MTRSAVSPYENHCATMPAPEDAASARACQQPQLEAIRDKQRRALDALDRVCEDLRRHDNDLTIDTIGALR